jgi:hypothetical protein
VADRAYSDAELDTALAALSEPGRLREAQDLVARAAPALHRVLEEAIGEGGWFDSAHEQAVREAAAEADPGLRTQAVRTLIAEETRLGMFVGVTVGFELARALGHAASAPEATPHAPAPEATPHATAPEATPHATAPEATPEQSASPEQKE